MAAPLACAWPALPLNSTEGFAEWAAGVCRARGVSDQTVAAMREGIKENDIDAETFRQGGTEDRELREGMRLPEMPATGEPPWRNHARRLLDGLAWRLLHAAAAGRGGMRVSAGELKAWVRQRMQPISNGVCNVIGTLGGAVCELRPEEAALLVPDQGDASEELLVRLGRMISCLRTAAAQGCSLPDTEGHVTVCVIGNTGAGKSTLLNALLGEESLLPTNAMRACTAAIIEIVYNFDLAADSSSHTAEIRFMPKEDWEGLVREAFKVLLKGGEGEDEEMEEEGAEKAESLAKQLRTKLYAAYGRDIDLAAGPEALLQKGGAINENLGKAVMLGAASGRQLREKYEHYVDSSNDASVGATWPIVQRVVLKGPWDLLCSGLRLVDAPGLQDDNSARDQVVRSYIRQADSLWLVSNIRRATNDKTTLDMMPAGFIQVLKDKGVPGSLAYIATQTDVMLRSEVIQNLPDRLSEVSTQLECALARNNFFKETMAEKFSRAQGAEDADMMQDAAGNGVREEGRFEFVSFAVSAVDYQKITGIRQGDGGPAVPWDEKATEVPRLQEFALNSVPALREADLKAGGALLDYLAEAKARAAREEAAALAELELLKNYRTTFEKALDKVDHVGLRMCHAEQLDLACAGSSLLSLSVAGVGPIGLPLCELQSTQLAGVGAAWEGPGGDGFSVVDGGGVTLSSGMRRLVQEAARKGQQELGVGALASAGGEFAVSCLIVAEKGVPFAAISSHAQSERAFGRMVVRVPSFSEPGRKLSVRVVHGGTCKEYDWGGGGSSESFYSVSAFSQCTIDVTRPSEHAAGRELFLVCDLLKPPCVVGLLPRLADDSETERLLKMAVRGMLTEKGEKIAIPLSVGFGKPPKECELVGREKVYVQLLREQKELDVGFAVVHKNCSTKDGSTKFSSDSVHGLDGVDLGFKFGFARKLASEEGAGGNANGKAVEGMFLCGDILCLSHQGKDVCLFEGVKANSSCMTEQFSRVVLVVWPRESTFTHLVKRGKVSALLDSAQEHVWSKDETAVDTLKAVAGRFASCSPISNPDVREITKLLQLFVDSGGLATEALCLVIRSLPDILNRLRHDQITVTPAMREVLLLVVEVYGWEGVKSSFDKFAREVGPKLINEHVVAVAAALAHQGFADFELVLLQRLERDNYMSGIPEVSVAELLKAALSYERLSPQAARLARTLSHISMKALVSVLEHFIYQACPDPAPTTADGQQLAREALGRCKQLAWAMRGRDVCSIVLGSSFVRASLRISDQDVARLCLNRLAQPTALRAEFENFFALAFPVPIHNTAEAQQLSGEALICCKQLAKAILLQSTYSSEESVSAFVRTLLRLNDAGLNALCFERLPPSSSRTTTSDLITLRMLKEYVSGLVLGSEGVSSAVQSLTPHLRGLELKTSFLVFTAVRDSARTKGCDIQPFTECMFKSMREKAELAAINTHLSLQQIQGLLDIVLPSNGIVLAGDGVTAGVVDDMLGIFFESLKSTAHSGAPVIDLVIRMKANVWLCQRRQQQQQQMGIADIVQRNLTPCTYYAVFFCISTSADPSVRVMIRQFAQPYLDSTVNMCDSLKDELLSKLCATFFSTPELSLEDRDCFFEKLLPMIKAKKEPSKGSLLAKIFQEKVLIAATSQHVLELAEICLVDLKNSPHVQKPVRRSVERGVFKGLEGDKTDRIERVNVFLRTETEDIVDIAGFSGIAQARAWAEKFERTIPNLRYVRANGAGSNSGVRITKQDYGYKELLAQHEENLRRQTQMASCIDAMRTRVEAMMKRVEAEEAAAAAAGAAAAEAAAAAAAAVEAAAAAAAAAEAAAAGAAEQEEEDAAASAAAQKAAAAASTAASSATAEEASAPGGCSVGAKRVAAGTPDTAAKKPRHGEASGAAPARDVPFLKLEPVLAAAGVEQELRQVGGALPAEGAGEGAGDPQAAHGGAPAVPPPDAPGAGPTVIDLTDID